MRVSIAALIGVVLLSVSVAAPANADEARRLVPDSAVTLRVVERSGESFTVDVTNPTTEVASFNRVGLYFVPVGRPDDSPQRLGVVEGDAVSNVAPHETLRVTLQAYCLDEHRAAPDGKTQYALAGRRMPTDLTNALAGEAHHSRDPQRAVWRVRAQNPTKLIGDSKQDDAGPSTRSNSRIISGE